MDLQLTDEQTWLSESIETMLSRRASDEEVADPAGNAQLWRELEEFGALSIGPGDEEGLGAVEAALIGRGLGAHLAGVPYVDSAAARYALDRIGERPDLTPNGTSAAACVNEPARRFAPLRPSCELTAEGLRGTKSAVAHAGAVDLYVVPAVRDGVPVAALVPADAPGIELGAEPSLDRAITQSLVRFEGAEALDRVIGGTDAAAFIDTLTAVGAVLAAAEATGAAGAVLELARDYASQRRQFGRPIGSFQAVRHILADMHVRVESSWSTVLYAAASLDESQPEALVNCSIAKAYAARGTLDVAQFALQVFGGIAFTEEHPAHRFLRRVIVRGRHFGSAEDHERLLGAGLAR
jgi:alkylation response protein AidB-like acyl-CoA dehydrogenase